MCFYWTSGTAADNMIKVFKAAGLDFYYDNMALYVIIDGTSYKTDYNHISDDLYNITLTRR